MAIERVSIDDAGRESNGVSSSPALSSDGRFIAFESAADNLVAGDTNAEQDIFVVDRQTNTIERVSVSDAGLEGNDSSLAPTISSDGRFVAFRSEADNLVSGDSNGKQDIFVVDRDTDTIKRISLNNSGLEANGDSFRPAISSDGRFITFQSTADNLVTGDSNGKQDIFVVDRDTDTIERVSIQNSGAEANGDSAEPTMSSDGRFITFESDATDLVSGDTNNRLDVFVFDRTTNTIESLALDTLGFQANGDLRYPSISGDGRYIAVESFADNLIPNDTNGAGEIFVVDRALKAIERVSIDSSGVQATNSSFFPTLSSDGQAITFYSDATNLVPDDTNGVQDVFRVDRATKTIERVSIGNTGTQGNAHSFLSTISGDGNFVSFVSAADSLTADDTNGVQDIFLFAARPTAALPSVTLIEIGGATRTVEAYASDRYQFVLTAQPLTDVTISLTADRDLSLEPTELRFTPDNFDTVQTVSVHAPADGIIADRTLTITHRIDSLDTNYDVLSIAPIAVRVIDTDDINEIQTQTRFHPRALSDRTDIITASSAGSFLLGKAGNDVLLGNQGPDRLFGQAGNDYLSGRDDADYLNGNDGDDWLDGGDAFDVLYGSTGNDILNGDGGTDLLFGGDGEDELFGGAGDDTLTGGNAADVFVLGEKLGTDTLTDFTAGVDRLNLINGLTFADVTIEAGDTPLTSRLRVAATGEVLAIFTATPFGAIAASDFV